VAVSQKKKEGGSRIEFYAKGMEAGFSFKEIEMLRHLAIQCNLQFPISLFLSQNQLDKCIHSMVRNIKMSGENEDRETQDFLSKIYDFRKKLELEKIQVKYSITSSRQITEGQMLRVLVTGTGSGVFKSQVVKNTSQYMTITRPVNKKGSVATSSLVQTGSKISVYFWREDDAGYVFDSEVLDEVFSAGISSLKITHGESLFRTQKRKSVRIKMHKAAFLYLVPNTEPPHKFEIDPGLKCFLEDISDSGCAVIVGGKADSGLRVKVQFALDNIPVCMTGTVRSVEYMNDANRSLLHIEAEPLPLEIRNHILGGMFGMLPDEDEDELPFRVLDGEVASLSADSGLSGGRTPAEADADGGALSGNAGYDTAAGTSMTQESNGG
jgi:c-di-GMP-binding flagellar brake protein YcgR